jgi:hypothetical protein
MLDAILRARDHEHGCLYSAITDCGAGGFSAPSARWANSSARRGPGTAPLKYDGPHLHRDLDQRGAGAHGARRAAETTSTLRADLLRARRRALRPRHVRHDRPRTDPQLRRPRSAACRWPSCTTASPPTARRRGAAPATSASPVRARPRDIAPMRCTTLLAHPNIASKHWIIRQYDHEVQGGTVVKPLVGPTAGPERCRGHRAGAGIAAWAWPSPAAWRPDWPAGAGRRPLPMTLAAIDECVRNLVCVGADPDRIAILDNFCWPVRRSRRIWARSSARRGCYDGAKAYRTPFVSGKDSLNNQFTTEDGARSRSRRRC